MVYFISSVNFVPHFGHPKAYETFVWTPCFYILGKTMFTSLKFHSILVHSIWICCSRQASQPNITTASGLIQSILKEGEVTKFTEEEEIRICSILCTSEYCMETTQQLEDKLREKVDPGLADKIDLNTQQDMFHK